jgi:predicted nuclease with RNAse H fold
MKVILGFDPGGKGAFGWAVCTDLDAGLNVIATGLADHAEGAVKDSLNALPKGGLVVCAGIDAPMFWVTDGYREVDRLVRKAIAHLGAKSPGGTVQHFNSLRGACVIQGLLIFRLLRREYPDLPITEAHPKALLWLMGIARRGHEPKNVTQRDIEEIAVTGKRFGSEDERDAILAAFAANMMVRNKSDWVDLLKHERKERILAGEPPIGYWMPKKDF